MRYYDSFISNFNRYPLTYSIDKCVIVGYLEFAKIDYLLSAIDKLYYKHLNITCEFVMSTPWFADGLYYWSTSHYENKKTYHFFITLVLGLKTE